MCKFEFFSQNAHSIFMALFVFFTCATTTSVPLMDYAQRLPRPWQIAPLKHGCSSRDEDWLK